MRSDYLPDKAFDHLLSALTPINRLALLVSIKTGLRISDVLSMRSSDLKQRMTIRELKTGKNKRIYLENELFNRLFVVKGKYFVFEGRLDQLQHRTRQAVYKDMKNVAKLFKINKKQISPHSARKLYAVSQRFNGKSTKDIQKLLNHDNEAVTLLYSMADVLVNRHT